MISERGDVLPALLEARFHSFDASRHPRGVHGKFTRSYMRSLPRLVGRGAWSVGADRATRRLLAGAVVDTEHAHRESLPDGRLGFYSPEREELHRRIVGLLTQHAGTHRGSARAIFLAGGPASGKSSLVDSGVVRVPGDAVRVDPDLVRSMLPEYGSLVRAGDPEAAAKTHEEASHVSKLVLNAALSGHHHVVVDAVGAGPAGRFSEKVKRTGAAGHRPEVHYVTVPLAEAERRAALRARRSGRAVPLGYLRVAHREVSQRFPEVRRIRGVHVRVYDNGGRSPRLIAEQRGGRALDVIDARRFGEFVRKGSGGG